MHLRHFGDSFDIVKQAILRWFAEFGEWAVHPMLTDVPSAEELSQFGRFLGARIVTRELLTPETNRIAYFEPCNTEGNLLLDPTTGIQSGSISARRLPEYLLARELEQLVKVRPGRLTVAFDQSLPRGRERQAIEGKLSRFASSGVLAFAYVSHACFVIAANEKPLLERAYRTFLQGSSLPSARLASAGAA